MSNENQHWVPKLLLRNFADARQVYCLDIHSDEIKKRPPKHAASEPGFNDFEIDGKAISFEDKLEKIETKAAPVLKRIVSAKNLVGLSPIDRQHVARFIATQSFRTKAFYEGLAGKPPREAFGTTFKYMWHSSVVTAAEIAHRHWALMVIEGDEVFYLGDNPVVLQRTRDPKDGTNLGFDVPGVEAFLPLSPKCALYIPCPATSHEIIVRYEAAMAVHRMVRLAVYSGIKGGGAELLDAQATMRRSHHIYKALTEATPIVAEPANIENLNYCNVAGPSMRSIQTARILRLPDMSSERAPSIATLCGHLYWRRAAFWFRSRGTPKCCDYGDKSSTITLIPLLRL
jgi:hypothetical protein